MDTGDPKEVKRNKTKRQLRRDREIIDLKTILDLAGGRDFVWRLLEQCGIYHTSFAGENTNLTNFNEGKRQIGLLILDEIHEANPNAYAQMQFERVKDE